jgi:hypothetical protein
VSTTAQTTPAAAQIVASLGCVQKIVRSAGSVADRVEVAIVSDYYYPQLGGITEHVHGQATEPHAVGTRSRS